MNWGTLSLLGGIAALGAAVLFFVGGALTRYLPAAVWGWAIFATEAALPTTRLLTIELPLAKVAPLAALAVLCAWLLVRPQGDDRSGLLNTPLRWLLYYVAWLFICALLAPDVVSALARVGQILLPLAAVVAARRGLRDTTSFLVAATVAGGLHVAYAVALNPNYVGLEGEQRLTGLLIPNTFGYSAALGAAGAFGLWLSRRGGLGGGLISLSVLAVCGYALAESAARTAAIAIVVAAAVAVVATPRQVGAASRRRAQLAMGGVLAVALYLLFQPRLIDSAVAVFARGNTHMGTLTGRIPLWERLLTAVLDHPFVGFGPAAYRDHEPELVAYLTAPEAGLSVAHNAGVEAMVAGGLPGGLLWIVAMVALVRHVWHTAEGIRPFAVAVHAVTAVSALTTSAAAGIGMGWFVIATLASLPLRGRSDAEPVEPGPARAQDVVAPTVGRHRIETATPDADVVRRVPHGSLPPVPPGRPPTGSGSLLNVAVEASRIPPATRAPRIDGPPRVIW